MLSVCGHANIDVLLRVQDLPGPGQSSPVQTRRTVYGGTAANVARQAGSLGVPVRLWSRVGGDFPPEWFAALEDDGVDLDFLDIDPDGLTPTCYILTDATDEQSYCMDQGAMAAMAENPPSEELLDGASWLHLATGDPAAYMDLAKAAADAGVQVGLDPGQELRFAYDPRSFERLLDRADVLFVNQHELDLALRYLNYGDPMQLLDHVDTLITTHSAQGATLYRQKGRPVHQDAFPAKVVDPTGAGDALRAGWYAGLAAGKDPETALRWGQAAASLAVARPGAQEPPIRPAELQTVLGSDV